MSLRKPQLLLVKSSRKPSRSLAKGITAGLVGGLVATAARALSQRAYPPRSRGEQPELPSGEAVPATRALAARKRLASSRALPWAVGAAAGAAYGAIAEYYPPATSKEGAGFGMALGALSQDGPLTAIGLIPPSETNRERTSEMTSFVVFGVVTETVRRVVRRVL
jgi:putative membrane protein